MSNPLISACIITYQHESYIRECIEGALIQIFNGQYEIVIGEDCSTDETKNICKEFAIKYPDKIRLICNDTNLGMVGNWINTLNNCTGKYIACCEGDDYWTDPYKLQKQVSFLENNLEYGLVFTDIDFYIQSKSTFKRGAFKNKILPIYYSFNDTIINKPYFAPPTWLFRREYIPKLHCYCDATFPMILDILAITKIKYLDEVTSTYRILDESASHSQSILKRYKFLKGVYRIQKDYIKKYKLSNKTEEKIDFKYYEAAYPYAAILGDIDAVEKGKLIFKSSPNKNMKIRFALFMSNFFLGIYILKIIYNNSLLKNFAAKLSIFRQSS